MTKKHTQRYIILPAINRKVALGAYIAAVKTAKARPDQEFREGLTTWWPTTGRDILQQFFNGVQERINAGIPYSQRGMAI